MDANILKEYRAIRQEYERISASQALIHARSAVARPTLDWQDDGRGKLVATFKRNGFELRATAQPDDYADLSWIGSFTDKWQPGAVKRQHVGRHEYAYFVPENPTDWHRRELRKLNYGKGEAALLAASYTRSDLHLLETYGDRWQEWLVTVTASRAGIELGQSSVGGVGGSENHAKTLDYLTETAFELAGEAVDGAQDALGRLLATRGE